MVSRCSLDEVVAYIDMAKKKSKSADQMEANPATSVPVVAPRMDSVATVSTPSVVVTEPAPNMATVIPVTPESALVHTNGVESNDIEAG